MKTFTIAGSKHLLEAFSKETGIPFYRTLESAVGYPYIVYKGHLIGCHERAATHFNLPEQYKEALQKAAQEYLNSIETKPLFYTEDFKDGSFPKKSCRNCKMENFSFATTCPPCSPHNLRRWQGELKGEPIYEGDECWLVFKDNLHIGFGNWLPGSNRNKAKYFSNEDNAKSYYNKLENAQQHLAEQTALARGIEVGTSLFSAGPKSFIGNLKRIRPNTTYNLSIEESCLITLDSGREYEYTLSAVLTLKELAKEEVRICKKYLDN